MILKIRNFESQSKWEYYDEIRHLSVSYSDYVLDEHGRVVTREKDDDGKQRVPDLDACYISLKKGLEDEGPTRVVTCCFHYRRHELAAEEEIFLAFSDAYLLNDRGKTLERL